MSCLSRVQFIVVGMAVVLVAGMSSFASAELNPFNDDFNRADGPVDGWTVHKGTWDILGNRLVTPPTTEETALFAGDPTDVLPGNYEMSFDWEFLSAGTVPAIGRHAGVLLNWNQLGDRFDGATTGYNVFWIDRAGDFGLTLARFDGGAFVPLHSGTFGLFADPPASIRVQVAGDNIRVFADGSTTPVIDAVDSTYRGGMAGLWTWTGGQEVAFDNVSIVEIAGPAPSVPHDDPGNFANPPAGLVSFWDFDEASGEVEGRTLNFAYDRVGSNDGTFMGSTARTAGLGIGAAEFHDANGEGVNVGSSISSSSSLTIEALFVTNWDGSDQSEFFRKEDGGNRILLSFQSGVHINNASGQLVGTAGTPGISLGLNVGGYGELDIAFDGLEGRPTLAEVADGNPHHIAATYDQATGVKSIYLDGALIGSVDLADGVALISGGGAAAIIGSSNGGEPFTGVLDEVAFYNVALSQAEIGVHIQNVLAGDNYFVPEPGSSLLAFIGLLGLAGLRRRRRS